MCRVVGVAVAGVAFRRMAACCAIAAMLAPAAALAQANGSSSAAGSGSVALPEIQVIGTTPVPPPRRAARRPAPAAARAATAPAAAPVAARATPAVAEPGAVDRDKIPSNVQTLSAADFDKGIAPDLLSALSRSVPGIWRSAIRPATNSSVTSIIAALSPPPSSAPRKVSRFIRTAYASTRCSAIPSIGTSSRKPRSAA